MDPATYVLIESLVTRLFEAIASLITGPFRAELERAVRQATANAVLLWWDGLFKGGVTTLLVALLIFVSIDYAVRRKG